MATPPNSHRGKPLSPTSTSATSLQSPKSTVGTTTNNDRGSSSTFRRQKKKSAQRALGQCCLSIAVAVVLLGLWLEFSGPTRILTGTGLSPDLSLSYLKNKYGGPPSKFIDVDGVSVHYRDQVEDDREGKQNNKEHEMPTVLLLHGTSSSLHTWDGWTEALLKEGFRVFRLDILGFGLTGPHVGDRNFDHSAQSYAHFIAHFAKAVGLQKFTLAGNSLGGLIATQVAGLYPELVEKLVLVDAAGPYPRDSIPLIFRIARIPLLNQILRYFTPRWVIKKNLMEVYYDHSKVTEDLVTRYYELTLREGNRKTIIERARTMHESGRAGNFDQRQNVKAIKAPTLLMWGKHDTWTPLSVAHRLQEDIKGSKLIIYENASHLPMEEIPKETVTDFIAFIKE